METIIKIAKPIKGCRTLLFSVLLILWSNQHIQAQSANGTITHGSSNQFTFDYTIVCGSPANTAVLTLEYTTAQPVGLAPQLFLGAGVFVSMNGPSPYTYTFTGLTNCDFSFQFYLAFASGGLYQSPTPLTPGTTNLPTELVAFEVRENPEGSVNLNWMTASEVNSDYVSIENTTDGINWNAVSRVNAAGNSQVMINYTHTDVAPNFSSEGMTYYRLKMIDFDGSFEYSPIRSLERTKGHDVMLSLFPNPASNELNMDFSKVDWNLGDVVLHVYNPLGRQVHSETIRNTETEQMNLLNLPSSIYFFQFIQGENIIYQTKVIKEN
jgi:hypothetical protein